MNRDFEKLRQQAEEVHRQLLDVEKTDSNFSNLAEVLEEISVYQIELEMQNQQLKEALVQKEVLEEKIRDQFSTLYEHIAVGYLTLDRSYKIINVNQAFADMMELSKAELTEKFLRHFLIQSDYDRMVSAIVGFLHQTNRTPLEFVFKTGPDLQGRLFANITVSAIDSVNTERQYIVSVTDISHVRQSELQARQARENADQMRRRLRQKQQLQEKLFAIIGHELRTPAAMMEMLLDVESPDLVKLRETSSNLLTILDDMQVVTHLEDSLNVEKVRASLSSVVESALQSKERLLLETHLRLHFESDALASFPMAINAQLIRQIVLYFITHAALQSRAQDLWIKIQSSKVSGCFELVFEDNGRDFSSDDARFSINASEQLISPSSGLILGLSTIKDLAVESLNGELTFLERAGGGSIFTLSLQLSAWPDDTEVRAVNPLAGKHVLLVEDNREILRMTESLLSEQNVIVGNAEDGAQALAMTQANEFDLVLTDIFMPVMDGYELTRKLRRSGFDKPIIAVTAATVGDEVSKILDEGADLALSKPVNFSRLCDAYANLIVDGSDK